MTVLIAVLRRLPVLAACVQAFIAFPALAEVSEVRLAQQFGVSYLPVMVLKNQRLIEKQAEKRGLGPLKVTFTTFGSGADMNTALLAGTLDFASGGVGPVLNIWGRTRGNIDVKGVAALGNLPLYLNTIDPKVKSIRDFTDKDRIALPAVKVSIQAVLLEMAAAKTFGEASYDRLDRLTVSMRHPDATAALLSGGTEITANFSVIPYQNRQLEDKRVHRVLSSYDIIGSPHTLNSLYGTSKFREENPKVYAAVVAALREAMEFINRDKLAAAKIYLAEEKSKLPLESVYKLITNPEVQFTVTPQGFMKFADFLHKIGTLKVQPASWKDVFFPEVHDENGS